MSNKIERVYLLLAACLAALIIASIWVWQVNAADSVPTITIEEVARNETVTIKGANFPANQAFAVRMGNYGTLGINGALSDTSVSSADGSFTTEVAIPAGVKDFSRIAIRLDGAGYYSFNWFWNNSTTVAASADGNSGNENRETSSSVDTSADQQVYTGIPALTFEKIEGEEVTVKTGNFPPNQTFYVSMGSYQSAGRGPSVGTIVSGDGTDTSHTFTIPARIAHYGYILVRAQTAHSNPFYATVGFNNPSGPIAAPDQDPEKEDGEQSNKQPDQQETKQILWLGTPSLKTCKVDAGKTVTIETNNLPTNLEYTVRMNTFGTRGIGGEAADTTISPGDSATAGGTFNIPASLANHGVIAIRVESGIYHAYGYFYNNTASVCDE